MNYRLNMQLNMLQNGTIVAGNRHIKAYKNSIPRGVIYTVLSSVAMRNRPVLPYRISQDIRKSHSVSRSYLWVSYWQWLVKLGATVHAKTNTLRLK